MITAFNSTLNIFVNMNKYVLRMSFCIVAIVPDFQDYLSYINEKKLVAAGISSNVLYTYLRMVYSLQQMS